MTEQITEARGVTITKGADAQRFRLQIINPGMGSSGYYSTEVLEAAVDANVFPSGTHLYVDHPTEDMANAPRGVRDLAGVTEGDAIWNPATQAIEAACKVYPHYSWLTEVAGDIGMSIRADGVVSEGTVDGKRTRVIDSLTECRSVDFVSKAGRGGKIIAAMESAKYQKGYAGDDPSVSLDSAQSASSSVTNYGAATTTEESSVGNESTITEAAHQAVVSERDSLATQLAEAQQENTVLKAEKRGRELRESATVFVNDTIGSRLDHRPDAFRQKVVAEAMRDIPTNGDQLDQAAMKTRVDNTITAEEAYAVALNGGQTVMGHGASTSTVVAESHAEREKSDQARKNIDWN